MSAIALIAFACAGLSGYCFGLIVAGRRVEDARRRVHAKADKIAASGYLRGTGAEIIPRFLANEFDDAIDDRDRRRHGPVPDLRGHAR